MYTLLHKLIILFFLIFLCLYSPHQLLAADLIGQVEVPGGNLKKNAQAKKELGKIAAKIKKADKADFIEIEGSASGSAATGYFNNSLLLAMEGELIVRDYLKQDADIYLTARKFESAAAIPTLRVILHSAKSEKFPLGISETSPSLPNQSESLDQTKAAVPITPAIDPDAEGHGIQFSGTVLSPEEARELDERLTKEQAVRATDLIERAKTKALEKAKLRALEEKLRAEEQLSTDTNDKK